MDSSFSTPTAPTTPPTAGSSATSLSQAFESAVDLHRDAIALIEPGDPAGQERATSYGELDAQTTQLARRLRRRGVGPETLVGLHVPRSGNAVRALLAILKAGGAYLPLDPGNPSQRLRFIAQDSDVRLVLTTESDISFGNEVEILDLSAELESARDESSERFDSGATEDTLAYAIYTSGSTGRPKGTLIAHGSVLHLMRESYSYLDVSPGHRVALQANLGFDASVMEWTAALTQGGALCPIPQRWIPTPEYPAHLARLGITHLFSPPSLLAADPFRVPSLRRLACGGERLTRALADRLLTDGDESLTLRNCFGPTETTIFATHGEVPRGDIGADFEPSLGHAVPGAPITLTDSQQREVSTGQEGEILIGGALLSRGYLGRPALTAARFIPNPWASTPGGRLYRTGDLGRHRDDGTLEFRGRIDRQVKVRGQRIELGEIEALISRQPAASAAAAVVVGKGEAAQIIAFYEGQEEGGSSDEARALRDTLAAELPRYMVPASFHRLDELPKTPNGKIDRESLVQQASSFESPQVSEGPLKTATERHLGNLWESMLGVPVSATSDFFSLGGHSLLAGQLAGHLESYIGRSVSLTAVFDHPTLEELAAYLDRLAVGQTGDQDRPIPPAAPPIQPADRSVPLPISFPQERVWFLNQLTEVGNTAYNFQATIHWQGPLRVDLFERALTEIVERHEVLRSTFTAPRGEASMTVQPPMPVIVPVVDLSALSTELREAEETRLIARGIDHPFDLSKLPLARWILFRNSIEDHRMLQIEHHFVHDGWSFALLSRELKELYIAFAAGRPSPLEPLPIQYGDYAVWEREWLSGDTLEELLDFWRDELRDLPTEAILPTDLPRPKVQSFRGSAYLGALPHELADNLRAFTRREGLSLYPVMLTAFLALLQRYSGRDDLAIGTAAVNRPRPEMDTMIGMVVNTMVLRLDLSGDPTVREALRRAREKTVSIYPHQQAPLDRLVDDVMPHRDLSRNPVVQTMFSFHDSPVPDLELGELQGKVRVQHNGSAKSDLNVIVVPGAEQRVGRERDREADRIDIMWEHCVDLLFEDTVVKLRGQYERLLTALLQSPEARLSQLPLLSPTERQQLESWERSAPAGPRQSRQGQQDVLERVHQQALQQPEAPAVTAPSAQGEDVSLSYGALGRKAQALATELRQHGARPGAIVAVLTGRRAELPLAILAALQTGAAYLPLDPEHPPERLRAMVEDAGAVALVFTEELRQRVPADLGDSLALLPLDAATAAEETLSSAAPQPLHPEQPAYLIYTSGSTGRPKAVVVSRGAIAHFISCCDDLLQLGSQDRTSLIASPSFDASGIELWAGLTNGTHLHAPTATVRAEPAELVRWIDEHRLSFALLPTPFLEAILQHRDEAGSNNLQSLRHVITGGAALRRFAPADFPAKIHNVYGPTEATIGATYDTLRTQSIHRGETLPSIGRPFPGYQIHLLDRRQARLPRAVPGHLHIGGPGLATGYHDRPALTASTFIPNPFATTPGERLYATGDLARFLPDGRLQFLGRLDQQVKLRGFRIEPGEIEAILQAHPGVANAVVLVRTTANDESQLVAYWLPSNADGETGDEVLHTHLAQHLPHYMIPTAWVSLPELPLTATGKLDHHALPDPATATARPYVAPRNDLEELLADFWCEILGLEDTPSIHDNFFHLGGQSLTAARLAGLIRDELEIDLPLGLIFDHPVLEGQAVEMEKWLPVEA
ncbi:MAG: amino acid adenylation domain-containing protein [Acidobacteriota bacterium]